MKSLFISFVFVYRFSTNITRLLFFCFSNMLHTFSALLSFAIKNMQTHYLTLFCSIYVINNILYVWNIQSNVHINNIKGIAMFTTSCICNLVYYFVVTWPVRWPFEQESASLKRRAYYEQATSWTGMIFYRSLFSVQTIFLSYLYLLWILNTLILYDMSEWFLSAV